MKEQQPSNGNRLDRIERAIEDFISIQTSHETRLDRVEASIEALVDDHSCAPRFS